MGMFTVCSQLRLGAGSHLDDRECENSSLAGHPLALVRTDSSLYLNFCLALAFRVRRWPKIGFKFPPRDGCRLPHART